MVTRLIGNHFARYLGLLAALSLAGCAVTPTVSTQYDPWRGHSGWSGQPRVDVDQQSEGRLNVDLVDRAQSILVWEGVAGQRLMQSTMSDLGPAMDNAVHQIFKQFPLPPQF